MKRFITGVFWSFRHAFRGLRVLMITQRNSKIHCYATVLVVLAGVYFRIDRTEWAVIALTIGLVWMAEAFNTAFEMLSDKITMDQDSLIRNVKDVSAGAVLLTALTSLAIGYLVFGPKILLALKGVPVGGV